jgi:hypothetical protein
MQGLRVILIDTAFEACTQHLQPGKRVKHASKDAIGLLPPETEFVRRIRATSGGCRISLELPEYSQLSS